jgi:hypothetical protein
MFKRAYPTLYAHLDVIGLRSSAGKYGHEGNLTLTEKNQLSAAALDNKFVAIVIFFILSIYLSSHFETQVKKAKEEDDFLE